MEPTSKLTLSPEELELVSDSRWILTKQAIIGKVYGIFGGLAERYQAIGAAHTVRADVLRMTPKIARGENYRQLPYVMLDYPRCFDGDDVFAIRTLFWWGNFFSLTLQLSGEYKKMHQLKLCHAFESLKEAGYYLCTSKDPWEHHFGEDNYRLVKEFSSEQFAAYVTGSTFVKLALRFPLPGWNEIPGRLEKNFYAMVELVGS